MPNVRALLLAAIAVALASCTTGLTYRLNCGGGAVFPYAADGNVSGGTPITTTSTIDLSGVANPAPMAVYQAVRSGTSTYTLANLSAGTAYQVRLHFAEIVYTAAGQRLFDVALNGTPVLTGFDIFAAAGGANRAVVRAFTATTTSTGQMTIALTAGAAGQPAIAGIEVVEAFQIDAGGPDVAPFQADAFFSGGTTQSTAAAIDTSGVTDPAPAAVYQTIRRGATSYTFTGLGAEATYKVRLHFAEIVFTQPGARQFNVRVAGLKVLSNFDIVAEAGGPNKAVVREFAARATTGGKITVALASGAASVPAIAGIEVVPDPSYAIDAGGSDVLPFYADDYVSGGTKSGTTASIDLSGVAANEPAPEGVYQKWRTGVSTYTFSNLQPGGQGYKVRLHFAELTATAAGQRKFDVRVNGELWLKDFDVFAAARTFFDQGNANRAVIYDISTQPDANGQIVVQFLTGSAGTPAINGIEVIPEGLYLVNAGGTATIGYATDGHVSGGTPITSTATIDLSGAPDPAPAVVYQSARQGTATYTFGDLLNRQHGVPTRYKVRLHFAELTATAAGQRRFDVAINGTPVLTDFDVFATAGGAAKAIVESFLVDASAAKQIVIALTPGAAGLPLVNGIEVIRLAAQQWASADALFHRDPNWRGSDGAFTVPLGGSRYLWLFGDTFVDLVPPLQRAGSTFIRNSVALQVGDEPETATFKGKWKLNGSTPSDYFPSPGVGHWYWPESGIVVNGRLVVFAADFTNPPSGLTTPNDVAFTVDDPSADPDVWTLASHPIPDPSFPSIGRIAPTSVVEEGGYLYVWGNGPKFGAICPTSNTYLWRYSDAAIAAADFSDPEWWTGTGTGYVARSAMTGDPAVVATGATGGTFYRNTAGQWVDIEGATCFGPLESRTAPAKEGPYGPFTTMYVSPDNARPWAFATYFWLPHFGFSGVLPGQIAMTYSTNGDASFTDESIYYPRFIKAIAP